MNQKANIVDIDWIARMCWLICIYTVHPLITAISYGVRIISFVIAMLQHIVTG
jgi:hypothetical protein